MIVNVCFFSVQGWMHLFLSPKRLLWPRIAFLDFRRVRPEYQNEGRRVLWVSKIANTQERVADDGGTGSLRPEIEGRISSIQVTRHETLNSSIVVFGCWSRSDLDPRSRA